MTISVCCPTRGRPARFAEMLSSLRETATGPVEVIAVLDDDDETFAEYPLKDVDWVIPSPPGVLQSGLWQVAWERATGEFALLADDDIVFRTNGWDVQVAREFEIWPDRIGAVFTADGTHDHPYVWPAHPFYTREFIEAVGYMTPPYFPSWHAEHWGVEIAQAVGRLRYIPGVLIEHMHHYLGKAEVDETYLRGASTNKAMELEGQRLFWSEECVAEREEQIARVRARIDQARAQEARAVREMLSGPETEMTQKHREGLHNLARSDNSAALDLGTSAYIEPRIDR